MESISIIPFVFSSDDEEEDEDDDGENDDDELTSAFMQEVQPMPTIYAIAFIFHIGKFVPSKGNINTLLDPDEDMLTTLYFPIYT